MHARTDLVAGFVEGIENAARAVHAVRGHVPTPGSLPQEVPTSLGTHSPEYLPPWVCILEGLGT